MNGAVREYLAASQTVAACGESASCADQREKFHRLLLQNNVVLPDPVSGSPALCYSSLSRARRFCRHNRLNDREISAPAGLTEFNPARPIAFAETTVYL
jgi:hypothetical protein